MSVDPQRAEIESGGEPAFESQGFDSAAALDQRLASLASQVEAEARGEPSSPPDPEVPSPPETPPRAPDGEPAADQQGSAAPSPDGDAIDPAIAELERRPNESRKAWVERVQAWGAEREQAANAANQRARDAEQQAQSQMTALQQRAAEFQQWIGPDPGTPEWDDLQRRAMDGDWQARGEFDTYAERRKYQGVIRLLSFHEMAEQLESLAESEGLARDEFRQSHGGQFGSAIGMIVRAAVGKVSAEKDALLAKATQDLKDEKTAHQSTRDRAAAGGLQMVSGGSPGGGGPLGRYLDSRGIATDEAIEAALEGRLVGLDLSMGGSG